MSDQKYQELNESLSKLATLIAVYEEKEKTLTAQKQTILSQLKELGINPKDLDSIIA